MGLRFSSPGKSHSHTQVSQDEIALVMETGEAAQVADRTMCWQRGTRQKHLVESRDFVQHSYSFNISALISIQKSSNSC